MRPYYEDGSVTIYHADSATFEWPDAVRLITDPPYGMGAYESDRIPDLTVLAGWIRHATTSAVFGYPEILVSWCAQMGHQPVEWVTWWPTNKMLGRGLLLPRESEHIAIFGDVCGARRLVRPRSQDSFARRKSIERGLDPDTCRLGDVWRDFSPGVASNGHLRQHPNEKPLSLMHKLVELCSEPGDLIIDPFAGSGTTLRAAKNLGRRAVGVEIEERYCEIAVARLGQEVLDVT
jgi:DNA methylase